MGAFGWPHILLILAVILLIFGATRLPALAKSLGQSARVFRGEMKAMKQDDTVAKPEDAASVPPSSTEASTNPSGTADTKP